MLTQQPKLDITSLIDRVLRSIVTTDILLQQLGSPVRVLLYVSEAAADIGAQAQRHQQAYLVA